MAKKKLLFLSAVILLMGTEGYGTLYPDGAKGEKVTNEKLVEPHLSSSTIISVNGNRYGIIEENVTINIKDNSLKGKKVLNISTTSSEKTINNGKLMASSGTQGLDIIAIQKGNFVNNGIIEATGEKTQGINITGENIKSENNGEIFASKNAVGVAIKNSKSTFINNGKINTKDNGTKGIYIEAGIVENTGEIFVQDKSIGVNLNGNDAQFNNKENGLIKIKNSIGAAIWNGKLNNSGNIIVENTGIGLDVKGENAKAENQEVGKIIVKGKDSKGINLRENGSGINKGTIKAEDAGIGVYFAGIGNFKNEKNGKIYSSGSYKEKGNDGKEIITSSRGIYLNNSGKAINEGQIIVGQDYIDDKGQTVSGAGAEGVTVNNDKAEFINENLIIVTGENSKGINISKGTAKNIEQIKVDSKAMGIYLNGETGIFTNEEKGSILVSGKDSKGLQLSKGEATNEGTIQVTNDGIGVFYSGDSKFINNGKMYIEGVNSKGIFINTPKKGEAINNGDINLKNGALGILTKGNVVNNGKISGVGTGVKLDNGYFINSGEITTTGSAIESVTGTNNTVYLKEGSKIDGKILGNTGIDVLAINGKQSNLNIDKYEAIVVRGGDTTITDSTIALEYNKGTKKYLEESKNKLDTLEKLNKVQDSSGNLTMENSKLAINFKDSLTNPNATENPIIDAGKLTFTGKTNLVFNSSDGRNEFNVNEALGLEGKKLDLSNAELDKTAVWDYQVDKNGNLVAKKENYQNVVTKGELKDFATVFDKNRSNMSGDLFNKVVKELDTLKTSGEFTQAMAQMSGGIHGYTVDISAINSRTLVNTMKNRALNGEYISNRANNSWTQDVVYLDSNHKMNGLMSASYDERGILGITEKQVYPNSRLGFVYGGSRGDAEFDNGISGNIRSTNTYLGGYYNYDFNNNISLNSNFSFVYGHNKVNRKINIGNYSEELKSNYPTYAMGIGTNVVYTLKDDQKNRALFYTGIDINRIMQGNINEKEELKIGDKNTTLMVKNASANEFSYYSITPNIGMTLQNSGYILDRKYLVGADFSWETEIGNIKDGKRLNMQGIPEQYKVGTVDRENVISASVFGQVDLTESLAVNGKYTIARSDKYDTDLMSLGMSYKMDSLADNLIIGPVLQGIENTRSTSDRWMGTFSFMFENEDDSDRAYYHSTENYLTGGDYATSTKVTPKFILNLIDKQSNWSYYFEGYYMANDFLKETKENENKFSSTRIHGEARWRELYSKGQYGLNIGYRNETAEKPALSTYEKPQRLKEGVHQLRLTPNFTYNLGSGFKFEAKPTSIFKYNYEGIREGQMDFVVEGEYYLTYSGFMPSWNLRLGYYREDRWMDHSNRKLVWDSVAKDISEARDSRRYQLNQLRPSATYYFGNGDNVTLSLRLPLGNGAWYNSLDNNKKGAESYETRYSVDYNHVVVPGFNVFGGITFLDIKTKNKDHASKDYGRITKSYSFRPKLGFSYNF